MPGGEEPDTSVTEDRSDRRTHDDVVDQPFGEAENLTRIVVEGETIAEWLRLHIDPRAPQVFSWERVFR